SDELNGRIVNKSVEHPDRVRAAADARDHRRRESARLPEHLLPRLTADDRLEVTDHAWIRRRSNDRSDYVVRVHNGRDPIADRFARRVLERARATRYRNDRRSHEPHAPDVECLTTHVFLAHVHDALEAVARTYGRCGDAVLARPRLSDDALFSHPP